MCDDELLAKCDGAIERPHFPGPGPALSDARRICEQCRAEETITFEIEEHGVMYMRTMPRPGREHGYHWYKTVCPIHGCELPGPPPCHCCRCFPEYLPTRDGLIRGRVDAVLREVGYRLEDQGSEGYSFQKVSTPEAAGLYGFHIEE